MTPLLLTACLIFGVADGDSVKAQCPGRPAMSVRLLGIDAPEIAHPALRIAEQPYGRESKAALTALCLGKTADLVVTKLDRYGRSLATVTCAGVDANAAQVRTGNAWAYLVPKRSPMRGLEDEAHLAGRGLWALPDPVPPSAWRKGLR